MLLGLALMVMLIASVTVPFAFADVTANRIWEFWEQWKLYQIEKAKKKQSEYYKFDYSKIQNKDPGFKTGIESKDIPKKHIQNTIIQSFKIIKQK